MISSIFPKKIHFENKKVRTADVNPLFLKIANIYWGSRSKKNVTILEKNKIVPMRDRSVNAIDLFSNQTLEFLANLVKKMP